MQLILVAALVFALIVAIFAIQNAITVQVVLFTWQFKTSLVVVIFAAAILGALSVGLFGLMQYIKLRLKLRKKEQEINKLESELNELSSGVNDNEGIELIQEEELAKDGETRTESEVKDNKEQEN
ncbi:LapA family protein [Sporohalobacter salinus]|uniref:LapA family protein n=1 Tax=Sporohalobacter salinus TaxID=1494606 RepID=UPI001961BFC6|nr:LapA family protein [Sporohalobacter salinus]MBM7623221.1 putative integral membrane protein [Sporohalobacter salinus]